MIASAAVASFSGLQGLAHIAGWPVRLAWLLPVTLDAYAMTSARVWLAASTRSAAARRFARANAIGAIAASIAGNATYHAARLEATFSQIEDIAAFNEVHFIRPKADAVTNRLSDAAVGPTRAAAAEASGAKGRTEGRMARAGWC